MTRNSTQTATGWKIVALAIIALGIGLRFVNLGKKVYWMDEAFTSLRVSGYRPTEVEREVFIGKEFTVAGFYKYQHVNSDRGVFYTVLSLAVSDPQHPPLYFVLARLWAGIVGDSPASLRLLSAVFGALIIPCIYWLCLELFQSPLTGWIAMILMAVSPFHLLYAQEARPYSLFALMTVISTVMLLRVIRLQRPRLWWAYALTIVLGLYTHLFFSMTIFAHGLYMLILMLRERAAKRDPWILFKPYLKASAVGVLLFAPWVLILAIYSEQVEASTTWLRADMKMIDLINFWIGAACSVFVDPKQNLQAPWNYPVRASVLLLIGVALFSLRRTTRPNSSLLVYALIAGTAIPLIVPDLIIGGRRSSVSRFWTPSHIGLQLAVARLLSTQLENVWHMRRQVWQAIAGTTIVAGTLSCAIIVQAETWWNKTTGEKTLQLAKTINQVEKPLLIGSYSPVNLGNVLVFEHLLNKDVRMRFTQASLLPPLKNLPHNVLVLRPSDKMRQRLEEFDGNRTLVPMTNRLWRWQDKKEVVGVDGQRQHLGDDRFVGD